MKVYESEISVREMAEALLGALEKLSISDTEFDSAMKIFNINHSKKLVNTRSTEVLRACSHNVQLSRVVFEQIDRDHIAFVYGLSLLETADAMAVLANVIEFNVPGSKRASVVLKLLNACQKLLKETASDDLGAVKSYLSVYFGIIAHFEITNPQHISVILKFLNPYVAEPERETKERDIHERSQHQSGIQESQQESEIQHERSQHQSEIQESQHQSGIQESNVQHERDSQHENHSDERPHPNEIYSLVILIVVENIKRDATESHEQIKDFLEILVDEEEDESKLSTTKYTNLIKSMESLFAITPTVISQIYTADKTKRIILHQINTKLHSPNSLSHHVNRLILINTLKLVGASCIDDKCRSFNVTNYLPLLKLAAKLDIDSHAEMKVLATLVTVSLWNFIQLDKEGKNDSSVTIDSLYSTLADSLKRSGTKDDESQRTTFEYTVEALAYLSLNTSVKKKLRNEEDLIEILVNSLKSESINDRASKDNLEKLSPRSTLVYGLLVIFANLTALKDNSKGQDRKTIDYLKNYSQPGSDKNNAEDKKEEIISFGSSLLLHHKIIDVISSLKTYKANEELPGKSKSPVSHNSNIVNQFVNIIFNLSSNQSRAARIELIKQGAINVLINFLVTSSKMSAASPGKYTRPIDPSNDQLVELRLNAIRSLARVLISANPQLAFKKYDMKTCLPFLTELLGPDISQYSGGLENPQTDDKYLYDHITALDKFESLMALTNISSSEDSEAKKLIISKTFDTYLDNFIVETDVPEIQRATWELLSNLVFEPTLLVKFFNYENNSKDVIKRSQLTIKLLNSRDERLQIAIANFLVNATSSFEFICHQLLDHDEIIEELTKQVVTIVQNQSQNNDLIMRLAYLSYNLVYAAASSEDTKHIRFFCQHVELSQSWEKVLVQGSTDRQVREILQSTFEILAQMKDE